MRAERRTERGLRSHLSGLAAEEAVARQYDGAGRPVCARRWRGSAGEIDLIARYVERMLSAGLNQKDPE